MFNLLNKMQPKNDNAQKLSETMRELNNSYQKEQLEYTEGQINKIRNSVKDRQSRLAWQTVKEMSEKNNTRAITQATSQEELIQKWKEHYKNLLGNFSQITNKPITKTINSQRSIKLGQFTKDELVEVLTEIKSRKTADLNEIRPEVRRTRKFCDILL